MDITVVGRGPLGRNLGALLVGAGHPVQQWTRTDGLASLVAACERSDTVVVAVPGLVAPDLLAQARIRASTLVIDATNVLGADWTPVALPDGVSNAERLQTRLPQAHVVKAFSTIFADNLAPERLGPSPVRPAAFVAGDAEAAKRRTLDLAARLGLLPVDAGPLASARHLEALAHLNIAIARARGGALDGRFAWVSGTPGPATHPTFRAETVPLPIDAYVQAREANGLVFLSGQLAYDAATGRVPEELTAPEQTERLLANLDHVLAAAGVGVDDLVKATLFVVDPADVLPVNAVYARWAGSQPPARSTLGVAFLARGAKVEIEVIAARRR